MIRGIPHTAISTSDLERLLAFYRDVLGLEPCHPETVDGAQIVSIRLGGVDVELLSPDATDGPISRYLEKRGPGIHHICLHVPNLDEALERCRRHGYHLVDETPRTGAAGRRIAFVHPKATAGILLELTE